MIFDSLFRSWTLPIQGIIKAAEGLPELLVAKTKAAEGLPELLVAKTKAAEGLPELLVAKTKAAKGLTGAG